MKAKQPNALPLSLMMVSLPKTRYSKSVPSQEAFATTNEVLNPVPTLKQQGSGKPTDDLTQY